MAVGLVVRRYRLIAAQAVGHLHSSSGATAQSTAANAGSLKPNRHLLMTG